MRVLGIVWTGVRVSHLGEAGSFFTDVLGLESENPGHRGFTTFRLPSGGKLEVYEPNPRWYPEQESAVSVGFEVEDIAAARLEMEGRGVEFVTDTAGSAERGFWCYFRGPDGVLYQLCSAGNSDNA